MPSWQIILMSVIGRNGGVGVRSGSVSCRFIHSFSFIATFCQVPFKSIHVTSWRDKICFTQTINHILLLQVSKYSKLLLLRGREQPLSFRLQSCTYSFFPALFLFLFALGFKPKKPHTSLVQTYVESSSLPTGSAHFPGCTETPTHFH